MTIGHDDHDGHDGYDGHTGHTGHDGHDGHDYRIKVPFVSRFYISLMMASIITAFGVKQIKYIFL